MSRVKDLYFSEFGHQFQVLSGAVKKEAFPHAWILYGPRQGEMSLFCKKFSAFLLGGIDGFGACFDKICHQSHPNFLEIRNKDSEEITVDQVREIKAFAQKTVLDGKWKIICVDHLASLNKNALNAFLKILEEPPPNTVFFLIAYLGTKIYAPVRSRSFLLSFQKDVPLSPSATLAGVEESKLFSELEERVKTEFSTSDLSHIIEAFSKTEESFRILRELLLMWQSSYVKRKMLSSDYEKRKFFQDLDILRSLLQKCEKLRLDKKHVILGIAFLMKKL